MPFVPDEQPATAGRFVPDAAWDPTSGTLNPAAIQPSDKGAGYLTAGLKGAAGLAENVGSGVSNTLARIPAGFAGAVQGAKNLIQGEPSDNMSAADREQQVEQAGTYSPHTAAGQQLAAAGAGGLAKARTALPDTPAWQTFAPAALDAGLSVTGGIGLVKGIAGGAAAAGRGVLESTVGEGDANGGAMGGAAPRWQVRPSDVARANPSLPDGAIPGSTKESFTSTPQLTAQMQRSNIAEATRYGGEDIGLTNANRITPEHISAAKQGPGSIYDETAQAVGTVGSNAPVLPKTVQALTDAAADDRPNVAMAPKTARDIPRIVQGLQSDKYPGTQLRTDIQMLRDDGSPAARDASEALENEFENQLQGQPQTLAAFKGARQQFAKIQDVEDSVGTGQQLDPQKLMALQDQGRPLSGALAEIANQARMHPGTMRIPGAVGAQSPAGVVSEIYRKAPGGNLIRKIPGMDITSPDMQARIQGAAPPSGPLPPSPGTNPTPLALATPPGAVGAAPSQLGMALAPGPAAAPALDLAPPPGSVMEPAQRGMALPQATGDLNVSPAVRQQMRLRDEQSLGTILAGSADDAALAGNAQNRRGARRVPVKHGE